MIAIDLLATILENSIIAIFIFYFFNLKSKIKLTILISLCVLESFIFNYVFTNNNLLTICLIITLVFYLVIECKTMNFTIFSLPIILIGLLLISNFLALCMVSFMFDISMILVSTDNSYIIMGMVISRIIFSIISIIIYILIKKNEETTALKEWWLLGILILTTFMMLATILESIILNKLSINLIYTLLIELIILLICSLWIYIKIQKQSKITIEMEKELTKKEYQSKLYKITDKMMNQINNDKHMMLYSLMNIDQLMSSGNSSELAIYVKQELNKYLNYKFLASTHNLLLDYELTKKINELLMKNIDVKTVLLINNYNELLDDDVLIKMMIKCIDLIIQNDYFDNKIELFLQERNGYILFKILLYNFNYSIDKSREQFTINHTKIIKTTIKVDELLTQIIFLIGDRK